MTDTAGCDEPFVAELGPLRSLQFDGLTVQSVMSVVEPDALALDYTRAMMGFLLFNPRPHHIVMVGLGGGSLAKYCLRTLPDTQFTAVEINPAVIALRDRFGIPPDDERFRVVCADGADYVRDCEDAPDVLLVDGFVAAGLPPRLGSADFYADCCRALTPGGVLVVNHWAGDSRYAVYAARLRDAFDGRVLAIGAEDGDNRISFAVSGPSFPPSRGQVLGRSAALSELHSFDVTDITQRVLGRLDRMMGRRAGGARIDS
jgi:spermidine synthase